MPSRNFKSVRDEIRFWMEKSFQVSFGYFGALVAVVALTRLDILEPLSGVLLIKPGAIVSITLLLLNFTYLTLATVCVFATLKRGYYILINSSDTGGSADDAAHWERFVRRSEGSLFSLPVISGLAWNVDNYYMVPLFLFILVGSGAAFVFGWSSAEGFLPKAILVSVAVLHAIPAGAILATGRLNNRCRAAVGEWDGS